MKYFESSPSYDSEFYQDIHARMQSIRDTEITVENIDTFADQTIDDLIGVVTTCVERYMSNHNVDGLTQQEIENIACEHYGLATIDDVLSRAQQKYDTVNLADRFIVERMARTDTFITPTDARPLTNLSGAEPDSFEIVRMSRLKALIYILVDHAIDMDTITITEGKLPPKDEIVRQTSYITVIVPELERIIQVCDERGNASYVFDSDRLMKAGISVDELNDFSKAEKNAIIDAQKGIGIRVAYSKDWINRMKILLGDTLPVEPEMPEQLTEDEKALIPKTIKGELHEWSGFYEDASSGIHIGTILSIAKKSGLSQFTVKRIIGELELTPTRIYAGRLINGYCYEDIMASPNTQELLARPSVEKEGEWAGFYCDPESGEHFGGMNTIARRLSVSGSMVTRAIADMEEEIKSLYVSTQTRSGNLAYSIEDIISNTGIGEFISLPRADIEGEWAGYYTDTNGIHWGSGRALRESFAISAGMLMSIVQENKLVGMPLVAGNTKTTGYRFEDFVGNTRIQELHDANKVNPNGENKGFYIDEEGECWGTQMRIAKELGISRIHLAKIVDFEPLATIPLRISISDTKETGVFSGYRLNDVVAALAGVGWLKA